MKKLLLLFTFSITVLFTYSQCVVNDTVIVNPTCNDSYDGSITITVIGGTGNYVYYWNGLPVPGTNSIDNLGDGTYFVNITDGGGCSLTETYTVVAPPQPQITYNITNATCYESCDGEVDIIVTGNSEPYTYYWDEGEPGTYAGGNTFVDICPFFYSGSIVEDNGCNTLFEFEISSPPYISVTISPMQTDCYGDNGSLDAIAQGGVVPYSYYWSNGEYTALIDSLPVDMYFLTVTDANGCTKVEYAAISNTGSLYAYLFQDSTINCHGESTADLVLSAMGTPPFTYSWNTGYEIIDTSAMNIRYETLPAGLYYVTISDSYAGSGSCPNIAWYEITEPEIIYSDVNRYDVMCFGGSTGSIELNTFGGTMWNSYFYTWSHDTTIVGAYAENLAAGTYTITVRDDMGCTVTEEVVVNQPDSLYADLLINNGCYNMNNGVVTMYTNGGTPDYYYSLDSLTWQVINSFEDLLPGTYTLYIKDINYCFAVPEPFEIVEPVLLEYTTQATPADCENINTGVAQVNPFGGTSPYELYWSNGDTTQSIVVSPGTYQVTIYDANYCEEFGEVIINQLSAAEISGHVQYSLGYLLSGAADVSLYKHVTGIVGMEQIDNISLVAGGVFEFTDIMPGDYSIKVVADTLIYPLFAGTWYSNTINWQDAVVFTLGCEDVIDTIQVEMIEIPTAQGQGSFSGVVHYWDNTKGLFAAGEPVEGAEIFVEQQPNDTPVAYATSNSDGFYQITGLTENFAYNIHVDIAGLPLLSTYNNIPVTSQTSDYENLNFYVDTTVVNGGIFVDTSASSPNVNIIDNIPSVYPNPVKTIANVSFKLEKPAEYSWILYDETGRFVDGISPELLLQGLYEYKVHITNVGVYYLVNKIDNNAYLKKLIKE